MNTFADFGLEPKVLQAITELGFEEATPIQAKSIPIALTGRDLIGQAQTGTGKTAAFGLPLINKIPKEEDRIVALVMTQPGSWPFRSLKKSASCPALKVPALFPSTADKTSYAKFAH